MLFNISNDQIPFNIRHFVLLLGFTLFSCTARDTPKEFKVGNYKCDYCMMGIADERFMAQAVTVKGKYHFFDSIECLEAWSHENTHKIHLAWLSNFFEKGEWIPLGEAKILYSKKLNSPMGAGLSAYETDDEVARAKKLYGGELLTPASLEKHIERWQENMVHR